MKKVIFAIIAICLIALSLNLVSAACNPPRLISPANGATVDSNVKLDWEDVPGAQIYGIRIYTPTGGTIDTYSYSSEIIPSQNGITLEAGKTYSWAVQVRTADCTGGLSGKSQFTIQNNQPIQMSILDIFVTDASGNSKTTFKQGEQIGLQFHADNLGGAGLFTAAWEVYDPSNSKILSASSTFSVYEKQKGWVYYWFPNLPANAKSGTYTFKAKITSPNSAEKSATFSVDGCVNECSYAGQKECIGNSGVRVCVKDSYGCLKWQIHSNCGSSYCGDWGSNSCSGNSVIRTRLCYDKGCSSESCYSNTRTDTETVQNCSTLGCSDGQCSVPQVICNKSTSYCKDGDVYTCSSDGTSETKLTECNEKSCNMSKGGCYSVYQEGWKCINSNNKGYQFSSGLWGYEEYCPLGCNSSTGNCIPHNPINQCPYNTFRECVDNSSYRTCGDYDYGPALEWSLPSNCPSGQYCSQGECKVNLSTCPFPSLNYCGSCNNICSANQVCTNGNCITLVPDQGTDDQTATCNNNNFCDATETALSCPKDCGFCGDGNCFSKENATSCPEDCYPLYKEKYDKCMKSQGVEIFTKTMAKIAANKLLDATTIYPKDTIVIKDKIPDFGDGGFTNDVYAKILFASKSATGMAMMTSCPIIAPATSACGTCLVACPVTGASCPCAGATCAADAVSISTCVVSTGAFSFFSYVDADRVCKYQKTECGDGYCEESEYWNGSNPCTADCLSKGEKIVIEAFSWKMCEGEKIEFKAYDRKNNPLDFDITGGNFITVEERLPTPYYSLQWRTEIGDAGAHNIEIKATDGNMSNSKNVIITLDRCTSVITKPECPYACCTGMPDYSDKACAKGYRCMNNKCLPYL